MVATHRRDVATKGQGDANDITNLVAAAVTTIEFEPGAIADLNRLFEDVAPRGADYRHHLRWGDDNGSSHVRAALLGPSLSVPIVDGKLTLGTWQQIMLLEMDTRPR